MDAAIMKYIPKSKRAAISDCWQDSDGYWIILKDGWNAGRMDTCGCHTIHEWTIQDLRYQIAGIEREKSDEELKITVPDSLKRYFQRSEEVNK